MSFAREHVIVSGMSPSALGFLPIFLLVAPLLHLMATGALGNFTTMLVIFGLVPFADALLGRDDVNPEPEHEEALARSRGFHLAIWAAAGLQAVVTLSTLSIASRQALSPVQLVDLALSAGILSGVVGINVAHELVHRPSKAERALGFGVLALLGYMHWGVEHVHGHHRWVATPRDPATARKGESLYAFIPRVLAGEIRGALAIERHRLAKSGEAGATWTSNRLLWFAAVQVGLLVAAAAVFGVVAAAVWVAASFVAILVLQVINYVEHYGLERRRIDDTRFERVAPAHSWDATAWLTNHLLFNLQRHADHHAHAARPYQLLRTTDDSPKLPSGYAAMLLLALVPPLWFRVMDPRVPAPA